MWNNNAGNVMKNERITVAVAIDKDKMSQFALKWATENVVSRGQTVTLIHVKQRQSSIPTPMGSTVSMSDVGEEVARTVRLQCDNQTREIFVPFRCFCARKDIKCNEVILEEPDISKALIDFSLSNAIEIMVVGGSSKNGLFRRFKGPDIAANLMKNAPGFCSVYVISKGKVMSVRKATCAAPKPATPAAAVNANSAVPVVAGAGGSQRGDRSPLIGNMPSEERESIRSPFTRGKGTNGRPYGEISVPECDISFVSSGRPSTERTSIDRISYDRVSFDMMEIAQGPRFSNGSEADRLSFDSSFSDRRSFDLNYLTDYSSSNNSFSTSSGEDVEYEMRRLRLELKQTMEMYNTACREALNAKQKAIDLQRSKMEEVHRLEEARVSEENAMAIAEKERNKTKAALEAAEAAQRVAKLESQKRFTAEAKALKDSEERKKALNTSSHYDARYRKYSIEEIESATNNFSASLKIGEGGYGPVYKSILDHTPVAIKVLRPDAAQGQAQFQQEVEILSCIRHPNMVLLLGACPEYGCLVYEYMSNGSLEDRLFCKSNTAPLPWQLRFRIAAEIATGLNFLHQTKPEPLVHRDLKPGNILIDRNYVSKISDVGLARLVPPLVADSVTQYRMTQTAGTFCYIDPEYQQTGMLGTKSDVYSLGILFLQLITARPAMGLSHHAKKAIEGGVFREWLDPAVKDWPIEAALEFAKLSLRCAELRRKDRPDLGSDVLPVLERLRDFAEENMAQFMFPARPGKPSKPSYAPSFQEVISENQLMDSGNFSS